MEKNEWVRKAIKEMYRILKDKKDKLYGIKWISPRTYIILNGPEKGIHNYKFNKKILINEFKRVGFKILDFWIDSNNYYRLLAIK